MVLRMKTLTKEPEQRFRTGNTETMNQDIGCSTHPSRGTLGTVLRCQSAGSRPPSVSSPCGSSSPIGHNRDEKSGHKVITYCIILL